MQKELISIKNVSHYYKLQKKIFCALDHVCLSVYENETLALVGESGSGKTTLGKILTGLLYPSSGEVYVENFDMKTYYSNRQNRKNIQMIFQNPYLSLNPRMTLKEILQEPFIIHKLPFNTDILEELLNNVGLSIDIIYRYPHQLSGGQRQRIAIARSLAIRPKILICDEPVSSLDITVQRQILELLKHLQQMYQLTIIFISHDLSVVRYISDRTAVFEKGKLIEIARTEQIFKNPKKDYTKQLLLSTLSYQTHI